MIRSNGLLSLNSGMNGGKFGQPHFQIRNFWHYLPQNTFRTACITIYMPLLALPYLSELLIPQFTILYVMIFFSEICICFSEVSIDIAQKYTLSPLNSKGQ